MSRKWAVSVVVAFLVFSVASSAWAQAELTGSPIQYVGMSSYGTMINSATHSILYFEPGGACAGDTFYPGTPYHAIWLEATGGGSTFSVRNDPGGTGTVQIPTVSGPTVSGRTITWTGRYVSGARAVTIQETYSYESADPYLRIEVVLTNSGTVDLSNVYFEIGGDPDHPNPAVAGGTFPGGLGNPSI
ncbi:MAG: hypothetical protein HY905_13830 [Deltaproteobacteria bacterium]|nr:hypothetical protein [Deltaproteobacteria bacterium]